MTKVSRQRKTTLAAEAAHTAAGAEAAGTVQAAEVQPADVQTAEAPAPRPAAKAKAAKSKNKQATSPEARKAKLVRDSFTMPKPEYEQLAQLKQRGTVLHRHVKKGELLRAGIATLSAMNDEAFLAALARVPSLKTGRPKSEQAERS